ncbi:MAG TPA: RnfABCDGE type electron transport complex subunit G [Firmicutes bacterium]|nr:RnfABCDGE type electron transport complex subunit G [Bacillota bacterium]
MRETTKLAITLALVCGIAAGSLAWVYGVTRPVIEKRAVEEFNASLRTVVPEAETFEKVQSGGKTYYKAIKGGKQVGAAAVTEARGYGSQPMVIVVGTDNEGKLTGVKVVSHSETPGLGARVDSKAFQDQFIGKTAQDAVSVGKDINAISGATISSRAFTAAVKAALTELQGVLGIGPGKAAPIAGVPKDGTYEGEGQGMNGSIKVSVTVKGGKITEVKILEHKETPIISDPALSRIPEAIIAKQSTSVDAVTGATFTSKGIMEAVKNALQGK